MAELYQKSRLTREFLYKSRNVPGLHSMACKDEDPISNETNSHRG
jgi:hypothetical protein